MGLLDQYAKFRDYIAANTPRSTRPVARPADVMREGLLNPNKFNAPAANRFKDSAFGLLGGVPGVGDAASAAEAADLFNRGEKVAGTFAALGALPLVPAIGGMFIGKGAKTWDALKAQQAEEMLAKGVDPREVWKQTGTFRGVDNALRQEIPDNAASFTQNVDEYGALKAKKKTGQEQANKYYGPLSETRATLDKALSHDLMFSAYPQHAGIEADIYAGGNFPRGRYTPTYKGLSDELVGRIEARGGDDAETLSTTLHELQHAIQQREGWAKGGSPDSSWAAVGDIEDALNAKKETLWAMMRGDIPGDKAAQKALRDEIHAMHANYEAVARDPMEAYRRLAGEAEARLTQARMNMTMPERLQSYPYDMLDVPQDQLIVRGLLDGPAMSYVDEAAQNGGGLLKNADNAGMGKTNNQWATKDVFGDGRQIEHVSPDGRSAVVQQTLPSGKTVFYPADVDTQYGWVRPDMYKQFDTFEAAQNKIKGMRISDSAKKRNAELYGDIPNTWTGDAKKVAKKLIDSGIAVSRFSSSTQSKSKYIELADGRKIRMSDHDLPPSYEGSDFDFRYGGDIAELLEKLK